MVPFSLIMITEFKYNLPKMLFAKMTTLASTSTRRLCVIVRSVEDSRTWRQRHTRRLRVWLFLA